MAGRGTDLRFYFRVTAGAFVVVAAIALANISLGRISTGASASAAYYCPDNGGAAYAYYGFCSPTLTTSPKPPVGKTGEQFRDEATLSGGSSPTGTITFRLYGPDDLLCADPPAFTDTVTVSGNGTYTSDPFTPGHSEFGTYQWTADYSGDSDNNPASSPCGLEPIEVLRIPAHFLAYQVGSVTPSLRTESVLLTDQFGPEQVNVSGTNLLLTPVEKRRTGKPAEPILRPEEHLECHAINGGVRQDKTVRIKNQFTDSTLLVKEPTRLCAPATKSLTGAPTAQPVDRQHYKCYNVGAPVLPDETVDLADQFGVKRVRMGRPDLLCNPASKQRAGRPVEPAPRPDEHLVCYRFTLIGSFARRNVFTLDQFISQRVQLRTPLMLCVPSEKTP